MRKNWCGVAVEICLIVLISATIGIIWNRSLLASAWRGEVASQTETAPASAAGAPAAAVQELPMPVGLQQVKELYDAKQAVLIDARNTRSFSEGHISGARSLPLEEARKHPALPFKEQIPKDATLIAYCNGFSCHDSMELGKILMQAGYGSVYVFEGGFPEWRDAGYPTAKGDS